MHLGLGILMISSTTLAKMRRSGFLLFVRQMFAHPVHHNDRMATQRRWLHSFAVHGEGYMMESPRGGPNRAG